MVYELWTIRVPASSIVLASSINSHGVPHIIAVEVFDTWYGIAQLLKTHLLSWHFALMV